MKCDQNKIIEYLYDEMNVEDKAAFELHLTRCEDCSVAAEKLGCTASLLREWPDEEPNLELNFGRRRRVVSLNPERFLSRPWRRLVPAVAIGCMALVGFLSLANFDLDYSDGSVHLSFRVLPADDGHTTVGQAEAMPVSRTELDSWKRESFQAMQAMINEAELRGRRENNYALTRLARTLDVKRQKDLEIIDSGLRIIQSTNEDKYRRTNNFVRQLINVSQRGQSNQPRKRDK